MPIYLMAMGRMDESAAESRRAVALDPVDDGLFDCLCWHCFAAHRYDESVALAQQLLSRQPDDMWERAILGWDYEQKHMYEPAIAEFKKAVDAFDPRRFGRKRRSLLDKAVAEHSTFLVYSKWEPRLDPLRSDPRFKQMLKRIGLPG